LATVGLPEDEVMATNRRLAIFHQLIQGFFLEFTRIILSFLNVFHSVFRSNFFKDPLGARTNSVNKKKKMFFYKSILADPSFFKLFIIGKFSFKAFPRLLRIQR